MHALINNLMTLAVGHLQKGDLASAEKLLKQSLTVAPKNSEALRLLGVTFAFKKDLQEALKALDKAIKVDPNNWLAHSNRGNVLKDLNQFDAALKSYDRTIALQPNYAEAYNNKGNLYQDLKRYEDAVKSYDQAIALQPNYADAYSNAGNALNKLNLLDLSLNAHEKAMQLGGENVAAYISCKMQLCDWGGIQGHLEKIQRGDIARKDLFYPFHILSICNSPQVIKEVTQSYMALHYPDKTDLWEFDKTKQNKKIRLGYFSPDFRNHAVSFLIAGLIEAHDKNKFELIAFSMGSDASDEMRERLKASFDQFIDISSKSDLEVAKLAREMQIDIAIDLAGITQNARPSIFAYRTAPIQMGYLGYLGTMAAPYYDYIIADEVIIPNEYRNAYSEKIIYLPSYQANDPKREISSRVFTREEFGISEASFVYCCFNNNYKFTPSILDSWSKILKSVDKGVMLLHAESDTVKRNLLAEFNSRGIESSRIFFAERLPRAEYLSRYRIADLFLDTSPYNAGTTASDALWAGLPALTFLGNTFSARMGGSLLKSVGLPEMICDSQKAYEDLAIMLGLNPSRCANVKEKLAANRLCTPLFDIKTFAANLENGLSQAHEKFLNGMLPDHIIINP
ncbi:tetratricopeptide repeat protein [Polynucleobacter sp. MWH-UH35A]|uniref:O-linked N-acetylglucosamine transferase, SPINDLY family protein n=1 Tax=Polynucleobacter sp. MWH-UH35A TaxID=1855619 RepID=UPI001BFD24C4|nr:tetratricopeptide repeat protein [Polynucleobacter sp. MWH-UH35A]QWD60253.1 tetratricopeptide repeat protein [Polynucleobacter sp. MWH-UH35A]